MGEKQLGRITWRAEVLERRFQALRRRYPEYFAMLARALDLQPGRRAVDVGCGSGPYGRLLAQEVGHNGLVLGIDLDRNLLGAGQESALVDGLNRSVYFIQGDALHLPLADSVADIVFCNTLLWILPKPEQAIEEMTRIVRPGGLVCASELDGGLWLRYDEDPHYLALAERAHQAFMVGVRKVDESDFQIGRKLPALFQRCGLVDLRAYPRLFVNLACDLGDRTLDEMREDYEWRLGLMSPDDQTAVDRWERTKRLQIAGGLSEAECEELRRLQKERIEEKLQDPQVVLTDISLTTWGGLTVTGRRST